MFSAKVNHKYKEYPNQLLGTMGEWLQIDNQNQ